MPIGNKISEDRICHCGTKKEAFEAALKLVESMVEKDCVAWAMQVISALGHIECILAAGSSLAPPGHPAVEGTLNALVEELTPVTHDDDIRTRLAALLVEVAIKAALGGVADKGLLEFMETDESETVQ